MNEILKNIRTTEELPEYINTLVKEYPEKNVFTVVVMADSDIDILNFCGSGPDEAVVTRALILNNNKLTKK